MFKMQQTTKEEVKTQSWYKTDNVTALLKWNIGTIDAGSTSPPLDVMIWNNRGGTADLSTMTNCNITTKDSAGSDTGELVLNTWIEVRDDSMGETGFTKVAGTVTRAIQAGGNTTNTQGAFSPTAKEILSVANDGSAASSKGNIA